TGRTKGMTPDELHKWAREFYPMTVKTAGSKIAAVTVIPGYDDHKLGRPEPRPITSRHNGETYRILWEEAIAAGPDWVLITSWNEWHEGSEIEPSREYGDRALEQTKVFARRFLKLPPRTVSQP
ncbi:MAG: glycoside hydrolase family 99-like domain-containing protein, partial [Bryobacteraceae bacterium]